MNCRKKRPRPDITPRWMKRLWAAMPWEVRKDRDRLRLQERRKAEQVRSLIKRHADHIQKLVESEAAVSRVLLRDPCLQRIPSQAGMYNPMGYHVKLEIPAPFGRWWGELGADERRQHADYVAHVIAHQLTNMMYQQCTYRW